MTEGKMITWTIARRDSLREAYIQAVRQGKHLFIFEGNEYVTGYAKYLLEFLDERFPK